MSHVAPQAQGHSCCQGQWKQTFPSSTAGIRPGGPLVLFPHQRPGGQLEGGAGDAPQVCWAPARGQAPQHSDLPLGSGSRSAPWSSALGSLGPSPAVGQLTEGSIMGGGPCVGLRNRRTGRGGTGLPGSRPGPRQTHLHIIRLRALHFSRILNRFLLYG